MNSYDELIDVEVSHDADGKPKLKYAGNLTLSTELLGDRIKQLEHIGEAGVLGANLHNQDLSEILVALQELKRLRGTSEGRAHNCDACQTTYKTAETNKGLWYCETCWPHHCVGGWPGGEDD